MKIKVDREKILPALNLVSSVVERRQTLPMLSNLYFDLQDGELRMVGTDMEMEMSETISEVEGDNGAFTLSMQKFLDIVRMLPENAAISVKQDKDTAIITSGRSRYTLKTMPSGEFPRITVENWEERLKIKQLELKALLDKTAFAMAVQDVRYYLNGILFQLSGKQFRSIATDGHRLAQTDIDIKSDMGEIRELIVPRKAVTEINRFIDSDEDAELTLEINKNHLKLSRGNTVLITKLIDGKFPEFKGVLENKLEIIVTINRAAFMDALNRVAVLTASSDRFRGIKLFLDKNLLRVTATNLEQEEAVEEVDIEYAGEAIESGYNVLYLKDVAQACQSETLELHLQGNDGICVLKQPGDERTIWLVMPMRI